MEHETRHLNTQKIIKTCLKIIFRDCELIFSKIEPWNLQKSEVPVAEGPVALRYILILSNNLHLDRIVGLRCCLPEFFPFSRLLRSIGWLSTDVSEQPVRPIFMGQVSKKT